MTDTRNPYRKNRTERIIKTDKLVSRGDAHVPDEIAIGTDVNDRAYAIHGTAENEYPSLAALLTAYGITPESWEAQTAPQKPSERSQTSRYLESLGDNMASSREKLIGRMRWLAQQLTEEADLLTADPNRQTSSNGYVASHSLSFEIDNASAQLYELENVRRRLAFVEAKDAK